MLYEMLTGKMPFTGPNAFVIMNDRLLNNPVPPREIDPTITPQLQEILYRAMERDPKQRYASAHEFAWDLEHPDQVGPSERPELTEWKKKRKPWLRHGSLLRDVGADTSGDLRIAAVGGKALRGAFLSLPQLTPVIPE